jgi:hypothetical protein
MRTAAAILRWLIGAADRAAGVLGLAVLVWIAFLLVISVRSKPFWHDEIFIILISGLPIGEIWHASLDGIDLNPPLTSAATRLVHAVAGVGPVTTRLVPVAGFLTAAALIFVMARRRTNALVAVSAALGFALTEGWGYALEARSYGLSMGLFAVALYAWTEFAGGRHRGRHLAIMSAALALGLWVHYYGLLAAVPIVVGELVRQLRQRRIDWTPWAALVMSAVATLPLAALARVASAQKSTFWARGEGIDLTNVYTFIRGGLQMSTVTLALLGAIAMVELARRALRREWPRTIVWHEVAAGAVCVAIPALALFLGQTLGVFDRRYAIMGTVGLALVIPIVVWAVTPRNGLGDLIMAGAFVLTFVQFTGRVLEDRPPWQHPYAERELLTDWLRSGDPIVVTGGVDFLPIWFYAPDGARSRVMYLADPARQLRETGTDTSDRGYLALARWTDVPVHRLDGFVREHPRFWLYSFGADWIERGLRARGARFVEYGRERSGNGRLFEVEMPGR